MYYIQEVDKHNFLERLFNIIKLDDNKILIPIKEKDEIDKEKDSRISLKIVKLLNRGNCKKVVISKELKKHKEFINILQSNDVNIVDGKWLAEVLMEKMIQYIIDKKDINPNEDKISILINDLTEISLENIKNILMKYKKVNIVTNHIEKFKRLEEEFEENGVILQISNNKRKSLAKSKIILNVDFPKELLNKYNIYDEAIIINIKTEANITKKRFNGIVIKDYQIVFNKLDGIEENLDLYDKKDIYQAKLYRREPYKSIMEQIEKDKVKISELLGSNTKI